MGNSLKYEGGTFSGRQVYKDFTVEVYDREGKSVNLGIFKGPLIKYFGQMHLVSVFGNA